MRFVRIGPLGREVPGVLVDRESWVNISSVTHDIDGTFLADDGPGRVQAALDNGTLPEPCPIGEERIGAPFARPHQILCIGLNYADHAAETGQAAPDEPIVFTKSPNTWVGPDDDVHAPRLSSKLDWEVELGVVVGQRCRYVPDVDAARAAIAGYVVVNDVSERAFQLERGGQWSKGKSAETFNPAGPELVTPDEVREVDALSMWTDVNGTRRQAGSTAMMLFRPAFLVHYLSQFMVLEPGDLINTGTPAGVGMGLNPPIWLHEGDVVELGIEGLGQQRQRIVAAP